MVESAYTDVSKAFAREGMRVRIPLPAPNEASWWAPATREPRFAPGCLVTTLAATSCQEHQQVSLVEASRPIGYAARLSVVLLIVVPCIRERRWIEHSACPSRV